MPIHPKERFLLLPHLFTRDLLVFHFIDYDRRQYLNMTIAPESIPPINPDDADADIRIRNYWHNCASTFLPWLCNSLDLEIGAFTVDPTKTGAELISSSNDPKECPAYSFSYPTRKELGLDDSVKSIRRLELFELERLGPSVDLVSFKDDESGEETQVGIFRYYFSSEGILKTIKDIQILAQLQSHPNIAHLTHAVLDDTGQVVVGFLLKNYLPTKPIFNNTTPVSSFKLSCLQHLIELIDSLNLTYGLVGGGAWFSDMYWAINFDELVLDSLAISKCITPDNALHDVYLSVVAIYEEITHQYSYADLANLSHADAKARATEILATKDGDWPQPPEVKLKGGDIEDFRRTLEDWVFKRKWVHFPVRHGTPPVAEEKSSDNSLYAEDIDDEASVGEKRIKAPEPVQSNKRPRRMRDELDEAYLPSSEKKIVLKEVRKVIEGRHGDRKECLLWDPETWKRDASLPQPTDNPTVNWLRVPEIKKKTGSAVSLEEENFSQCDEMPFLGKNAQVVHRDENLESNNEEEKTNNVGVEEKEQVEENENDEDHEILRVAQEIIRAAKATVRTTNFEPEKTEEEGYESDDEGANATGEETQVEQ
ncbi:hypothetical protein QBC43DRAFT_358023 [Cladorrhinum sp. PSN259]|nr:hypothetical protein QBC43DRAFT_358023 [Cladorrhinum sp. PSN259]